MTARPFAQDLDFGRAAEKDPQVLALLGKLYPGCPIEPAPSDLDRRGVDLIIRRPHFPIPVQIKRYRGSLHPLKHAAVFLETTADLDRGTPGWLWTSPAELLIVVYTDGLLVLHLPTLRAIAEANRARWGDYLRETRTEGYGGRTWISLVWRVPLEEVEPAVLDVPQ
ncbi:MULTISPECIES: hypothetical protein [Thermus]|jgi:hypothetical protein|uniref:Uncharacterized protein n=1 Tax=Thermus brockianus TaxID=56956 RepID=A0A1J0LUG7_THEBO|nr:hypothetical protein [Thermus brockianus]APD10006.1 hypothetical protein A0O31_01931 [Thermus brockianus]